MLDTINNILSERGLTKVTTDLPKISNIKGFKSLVSSIVKAIEDNREIWLHHDLDADGLLSFSITYHFMKQVGIDLKVSTYSRSKDGYGSFHLLDSQIPKGAFLLMEDLGGSIPIGIVDTLKSKDIDIAIIDHHVVSSSYAEILRTKVEFIDINSGDDSYIFKELCATQLTFWVMYAVNTEMNSKIDMSQFLSIYAIGTIGDMMTVGSFNRPYVELGLKLFRTTVVPFLKVMKDSLFQYNDPTSIDISFSLVPMLNASHRMDNSKIAIDLIKYGEFTDFKALKTLNESRKELTQQFIPHTEHSKFVLARSQSLKGLLGLQANKLLQIYNKPIIVLGGSDKLSGSSRSPSGIDFLTVLNGFKSEKISAGHQAANGVFNLVESEIPLLINYLNSTIDLSLIKPVDTIAGRLNSNDISYELIEAIKAGEPYGKDNPVLVFESTELVIGVQQMKKGFKKVSLESGKTLFIFRSDIQVSAFEEFTFKYTIQDIDTLFFN